MENIACALVAILWTSLCPTADQPPGDRQVVQQQIADIGAVGIFEPLTSQRGWRARHKPSGMTCAVVFEAGGELYIEEPNNPNSMVGCSQRIGPQAIQIVARRIGGLDPVSALMMEARNKARTDRGQVVSRTETLAGRQVTWARWTSAPDRGGAVIGRMRAGFTSGDWAVLIVFDADLDGATPEDFDALADELLREVVGASR